MKAISRKSFDSVTQIFHDVSGIRLGDNKMALVTGRLQRLAQEAGETDVDRYVDRLVNGSFSAQEMRRVIDRLTTNETYFFREPQHFDDLARRVAAMPATQQITLWSAASSSGEEAFSAAMVLADKAGKRPWRIVGTDLSSSVVASARRGLYPAERARMMPEAYLKRFCLKGNGPYEGQMLIGRDLREKVSFQEANLMQDLPEDLPMFDIIFLRNVLIYFDLPTKQKVLRAVLSRLRPGGVLFVGMAESLNGVLDEVQSVAPGAYTLRRA